MVGVSEVGAIRVSNRPIVARGVRVVDRFLRVKFKEIELAKSRRTGKITRSKKPGTAHKFENSWDTSRGLAATAISLRQFFKFVLMVEK